MIKTLKNRILGNVNLQPIFTFFYKVGLKGMNYDRGQVVEHSGEEYVLTFIRNRFPEKQLTIFDVGANYGQYSTMALHTLKPPFTIYAFEPQKKAYNHLSTNVTHPSVLVFNQGLGSSNEHATLYNEEEGSVFGSLNQSSHAHMPEEKVNKETVYVETLDKFCTDHNITNIDLLKMDVEGYEMEVLKGAKNMIDNGGIQAIQFEVGPATLQARVFMKDFFTLLHRYDIYRILSNGISKLDYSERVEIFLATNYLAVKKT